MELHAVNFGRKILLKRRFLGGIWVILRGFFLVFLDEKGRKEPLILVQISIEKPISRAINRVNGSPKLQTLNPQP